MLSQQIRRNFLNYFQKQGHTIVPSSSVVPHEDPTLLFCNAGMNQFKELFLGKSRADYTKAATAQKCIRVGGKHNDLENVGHTSRHLTFFEMLGNFSFGDYFKEEAISFAWQITTEVFGFESEKIWVSVFREDDEAFDIWCRYLPESRLVRLDEKDNFWMMGESGPCGPCSELLYDRGEAFGQAKSPYEDTLGERYLEFWNLVFMQFNRDHLGKMATLPKRSIDTGAGLERVVMLKMGIDSVFLTDVLRGLISKVEEIAQVKYQPHDEKKAAPFHVIADHIRCLAFAIADGVMPSNMDRGYVLRKVLRRAVRYGRQLGLNTPFLARMVPSLIESMGTDYLDLVQSQSTIAEVLTLEEEAFLRTLQRGGNLLNQIIEQSAAQGGTLCGDDAFRLKDTYGLPLEEILLIAKDAHLGVDLERYQKLEEEAKERSRSVSKNVQQMAQESLFEKYVHSHGECRFSGYEQMQGEGVVTALFVDGQPVDKILAGQSGMALLDHTPFYAEKGGQVGDEGVLLGEGIRFVVEDCQSPYPGVIAHIGKVVEGDLSLETSLHAQVDQERRKKIANNHTATHLLHWALQAVLGNQIKQAGSEVAPDRLRFDFTYHKALSFEEVCQIEDLVNAKICDNEAVSTCEMDYAQAQKERDIKQFFGEKYGLRVRMVSIQPFSKELCGGTHTERTGNIGLFLIAEEKSIASGVRRIVALTGGEAIAYVRAKQNLIEEASAMLKSSPHKLLERINGLMEENTQYARQMKAAKEQQAIEEAQRLASQVQQVGTISCVIAQTSLDAADLKVVVETLLRQLSPVVVILGCRLADRCALAAGVSQELIQRGVKASALIKELAAIVGGGGGGKADFAQAGGKEPQKLEEALAKAKELIASC